MAEETEIYTIGNQKGGIGKTATAIGGAGAEAARGKKTLLIETDPSAHIARGLTWSASLEIEARQKRGIPTTPELEGWLAIEEEEAESAEKEGREATPIDLYRAPGPSLFQAMIPEATSMVGSAAKKKQKITPNQLIRVLPYEEFDLVPSHIELTNLQGWLHSVQRNRENRLRDFVLEILKMDVYDRIIIDTPPDLGPITDNALVAAAIHGGTIVPVEAETTSLNAIELFFEQIDSLREELNIVVPILAVVPNKVEDSSISTRTLRIMREQLVDQQGCLVTPFEIRKRTIQKDAYDVGRSVFSYWPKEHSPRQAIQEMRKWYTQLAEFVEQRTRERG